ncbi:hypothetical protein N8083_01370 [Candidatus Pacebacteria bacterium]|nr:hypothetical protein [Candidatus Paceibacterota bacterium]
MKLEALLQDILEDSRIEEITSRHRLAVGIPKNGFKTADEIAEWSKEHKDSKLTKIFDEYFKEIEPLIPYQSILSHSSLRSIFASIFYLLDPDINSLAKQYEHDVFELSIVIDGKVFGNNGSSEDGLYLRIPTANGPNDIRDFAKKHKDEILAFQEIYNTKKDYSTPNIRRSGTFKRDQLIAALNTISDQGIEALTSIKNTFEYRDMYIAEVMREHMGYTKVTSTVVEHVRKRRGKSKLAKNK